MALIRFDVMRRWSADVAFTAEIECAADAPVSVKLGLAVKWAIKTRADLAGADLAGANLTRADLAGANLTRADLTRANLTRANLTRADLAGADLAGADLRSFKADMWMTLHQHPGEVPGLIAALRAGEVDGSSYSATCACLVGTIAKVAGVDYRSFEHNSDNPAERWFMMIHAGDKPGDATGGGFASAKALEWALEYCALAGIAVDAPNASVPA